MVTEMNLEEYKPEVLYTPAVIRFDEEKLNAQIGEFTAKYADYVVSSENLNTAKSDRAILRKLYKALEDRRKEIKKRLNEPYKEFEDKFKIAIARIYEPINNIDKQVKAYEEKIKVERLEKIAEIFKLKSDESGLDYRIFESKFEKFALAANFTDKNNPKKIISDEADYLITNEVARKKKYDEDVTAICELCADYNLGSAAYVRNLENGAELSEIINIITADARAHAEKMSRDEEMARKAAEYQTSQLEQSFAVPQRTQLSHHEQIQPQNDLKQNNDEVHQQTQERKKRMKVVIELMIDPNKPKFKAFLDDNGFEYTYKIVEVED